MKSLKFLFLVTFMAIIVIGVKVQVPTNVATSLLFQVKFTEAKVRNVMRSSVTPVTGQNLILTNFNSALDANKAKIDWGANRYLMFFPEVDNAKSTNSFVDDINNNGVKYNISLKLFESDGTLVKVVSKWGKIIGIGNDGFIYEVEGKYGTFFGMSEITVSRFGYIPIVAIACKMSEMPKVGAGLEPKLVIGERGYGIVKVFNGSVGSIVDEYSGQELLVLRPSLLNEMALF